MANFESDIKRLVALTVEISTLENDNSKSSRAIKNEEVYRTKTGSLKECLPLMDEIRKIKGREQRIEEATKQLNELKEILKKDFIESGVVTISSISYNGSMYRVRAEKEDGSNEITDLIVNLTDYLH